MNIQKLAFLSIAMFLLSLKSNAINRNVYPGGSIQAEIDSCSAGDVVIVHAGTYTQSVSIVGVSGITLTK